MNGVGGGEEPGAESKSGSGPGGRTGVEVMYVGAKAAEEQLGLFTKASSGINYFHGQIRDCEFTGRVSFFFSKRFATRFIFFFKLK